MRVRRILLDEHEERVRRVFCPRCKFYALQKCQVDINSDLPKIKYKFVNSFWSCGSPQGFNCYFLSSLDGLVLFESSEDVSPLDFNEEIQKPTGAKIIRRRKGEITVL